MNLLPSGENLTQLTKFEWSLQINKPKLFSVKIQTCMCFVSTSLNTYLQIKRFGKRKKKKLKRLDSKLHPLSFGELSISSLEFIFCHFSPQNFNIRVKLV